MFVLQRLQGEVEGYDALREAYDAMVGQLEDSQGTVARQQVRGPTLSSICSIILTPSTFLLLIAVCTPAGSSAGIEVGPAAGLVH